MGEGIHHQAPVLLGVSFGGMIAIEIAKQMKVGSLIIISSVKTSRELPRWMRVAGRLYLHKIIPTRSYKFTEKFDNQRLGVTSEKERELVNFYRQKIDPVYSNWAIHQVLNWKNSWVPESMVHIHGEEDKIFPIKNVRPTHVVKQGTHLMIVNRGEEVSQCINAVL
jgi:pimeloyl-ACP methyl ester carboxylesterase